MSPWGQAEQFESAFLPGPRPPRRAIQSPLGEKPGHGLGQFGSRASEASSVSATSRLKPDWEPTTTGLSRPRERRGRYRRSRPFAVFLRSERARAGTAKGGRKAGFKQNRLSTEHCEDHFVALIEMHRRPIARLETRDGIGFTGRCKIVQAGLGVMGRSSGAFGYGHRFGPTTWPPRMPPASRATRTRAQGQPTDGGSTWACDRIRPIRLRRSSSSSPLLHHQVFHYGRVASRAWAPCRTLPPVYPSFSD